jgi:hypothetical protein
MVHELDAAAALASRRGLPTVLTGDRCQTRAATLHEPAALVVDQSSGCRRAPLLVTKRRFLLLTPATPGCDDIASRKCSCSFLVEATK